MLSLHREQEAASAYRYEVEKLDLPPGLPPSSQLQVHSGVKADTAGAMLEPASQSPQPYRPVEWVCVGGRGQPELDGWGEGCS